jgi:F0F1-type ATP synthase epsilon subunit
MASLTQGNIIVNTDKGNQNISVEGGVVEVSKNKVTVLAL